MAPRVRFAPSPTGYLHVGGARTALFNWLFARKTGGTFVLRIEDTDKERSTESHTQVILDGLKWLGITYDEDPSFQGTFGPRHKADAERLLAQDKAYRCFCTREELDAQREVAVKAGTAFRYDGRCGRLSAAEIKSRMDQRLPFSIRLRMPDTEIAWVDAVHDRISFQGHDLDDFIILRSDGTPIYNLAVVSDDIEMKITHVIRGDDHISNTPKQIAIYRAMGAGEPIFAHVPMILGSDGKKLSKRHGATAVGDYQNQGILPLAMRNFLALLGWSPGGDREIMAESEMIELFSLEGIQRKAAVFDVTKLEWMNGQYLSDLPASELLGPVKRLLDELRVNYEGKDLEHLIHTVKARSRTLIDIAKQVQVRVRDTMETPDDKSQKLINKMGPQVFYASLTNTAKALSTIDVKKWDSSTTLEVISKLSNDTQFKLGDIMQPVRIAVTGSTVSEPVNELLGVVGKDVALTKIQAFLNSPSNSAHKP
jgi:glutamyl-tRNA synthetase